MKIVIITLTLLITLFFNLNLQASNPAKPSVPTPPAAEQLEVQPPLYTESPEYFRALLKRVKEDRRTAEQDLIDMQTVGTALVIKAVSYKDLGITEGEFATLLRGVALKSVRSTLSLISQGEIVNKDDLTLAKRECAEAIMAFGFTLKELGVSQKELDKLLEE